jgi:hypothetical protein
MKKSARLLKPGDRIIYLSGKVKNFTGHRVNVPMSGTVTEVIGTRLQMIIQLTNGEILEFTRHDFVEIPEDEPERDYKVPARQRAEAVRGVTIE